MGAIWCNTRLGTTVAEAGVQIHPMNPMNNVWEFRANQRNEFHLPCEAPASGGCSSCAQGRDLARPIS